MRDKITKSLSALITLSLSSCVGIKYEPAIIPETNNFQLIPLSEQEQIDSYYTNPKNYIPKRR